MGTSGNVPESHGGQLWGKYGMKLLSQEISEKEGEGGPNIERGSLKNS